MRRVRIRFAADCQHVGVERAPKRLQSARVFSNTEAGMRKGESNPP